MQLADFGNRLHHPRRSFHHARRCREAAHLVGVLLALVEPGIERFAGNAPQHDNGRIVDDVRYLAQRRGRFHGGPDVQRRLAFGNQRAEARSPARRAASGPAGHQVDQRLFHFEAGQVEDVFLGLEIAVIAQQAAKFAHLVEEQVGVPVLAIELVAFDIGEDAAGQLDHLVVSGAFLVAGQKVAIAFDQVLPFGHQAFGRALDILAGADLGGIAGDRGEGQRQVIVP